MICALSFGTLKLYWFNRLPFTSGFDSFILLTTFRLTHVKSVSQWFTESRGFLLALRFTKITPQSLRTWRVDHQVHMIT